MTPRVTWLLTCLAAAVDAHAAVVGAQPCFLSSSALAVSPRAVQRAPRIGLPLATLREDFDIEPRSKEPRTGFLGAFLSPIEEVLHTYAPHEAAPYVTEHTLHEAAHGGTSSAETAAEELPGNQLLEGRLLMLLVAMLWGTNFPGVKALINSGLPVSFAAAARFTVAAAAFAPTLATAGPLPAELVARGLECGAWIALGYVAQAIALQDVPAGVVAFIASLQVVFVPLVTVARGGSLPARLALSSALCVCGVGLLELGSNADLDSLIATLPALIQPIAFGTSYLRIEACMAKFPDHARALSALQLVAVAALAWLWAVASAHSLGDVSGLDMIESTRQGMQYGLNLLGDALHEWTVVGGVLYTGLASTALTVWLQTRALGKLPAADSSVIVATEPVFAAAFAAVLLGESLSPMAMLGGALVVGGCLANNLLPESLGAAEPEVASTGAESQ